MRVYEEDEIVKESYCIDPHGDEPTQLYRHFSADDELLYVGMTRDVHQRTKSHSRSAEWVHMVSYITVENFANRELASRAEIQAYDDERPLFNKIRPIPFLIDWQYYTAPIGPMEPSPLRELYPDGENERTTGQWGEWWTVNEIREMTHRNASSITRINNFNSEALGNSESGKVLRGISVASIDRWLAACAIRLLHNWQKDDARRLAKALRESCAAAGIEPPI